MKSAAFAVPVHVLDRHAELTRLDFDLSDEYTLPLSPEELAQSLAGESVEVELC
jgi:hypothetical protein